MVAMGEVHETHPFNPGLSTDDADDGGVSDTGKGLAELGWGSNVFMGCFGGKGVVQTSKRVVL